MAKQLTEDELHKLIVRRVQEALGTLIEEARQQDEHRKMHITVQRTDWSKIEGELTTGLEVKA
ncbi:MAG TPA: hypothetical protein VFA41_13290 [Ktedonobacteraceae bacterium]|jgi:hypothetical protein|nr:hypothetical protein [Ktedonobacteraceae bacterium]